MIRTSSGVLRKAGEGSRIPALRRRSEGAPYVLGAGRKNRRTWSFKGKEAFMGSSGRSLERKEGKGIDPAKLPT